MSENKRKTGRRAPSGKHEFSKETFGQFMTAANELTLDQLREQCGNDNERANVISGFVATWRQLGLDAAWELYEEAMYGDD